MLDFALKTACTTSLNLYYAKNACEQNWDSSNYLVDLAGTYATCTNRGVSEPIVAIEERPPGTPIKVLLGTYDGKAKDAKTAEILIEKDLQNWLIDTLYRAEVELPVPVITALCVNTFPGFCY